jgi:hypothetical protein
MSVAAFAHIMEWAVLMHDRKNTFVFMIVLSVPTETAFGNRIFNVFLVDFPDSLLA